MAILKGQRTKANASPAEAWNRSFAQAAKTGAHCAAPCPHFSQCGGCELQDRPYTEQLRIKQDLFSSFLAERDHAGLLRNASLQVITSPLPFHYRQRMDFVTSTGRCGLRAAGRQILDVDSCQLITPQSQALVRQLHARALALGLPDYDLDSHQGFLRYITVRHTRSGQTLIALITSSQDYPEAMDSLAQTALALGAHSVHWCVNSVKADSNLGDSFRHWGERYITETLLGRRFLIGPATFFQANLEVAEMAYSLIRADVAAVAPDLLLDLYSGGCTMPILFGDLARQVTAVENWPENLHLAKMNMAANQLRNCQLIEEAVETYLPRCTLQPDYMVLNPPRRGMEEKALREVLRLAPPRMAYLSCHSLTLLEDMGILGRSYRATQIWLLDMFPQTPHFETLVLLQKR